jgi:hypothetical protein
MKIDLAKLAKLIPNEEERAVCKIYSSGIL